MWRTIKSVLKGLGLFYLYVIGFGLVCFAFAMLVVGIAVGIGKLTGLDDAKVPAGLGGALIAGLIVTRFVMLHKSDRRSRQRRVSAEEWNAALEAEVRRLRNPQWAGLVDKHGKWLADGLRDGKDDAGREIIRAFYNPFIISEVYVAVDRESRKPLERAVLVCAGEKHQLANQLR